jgi:hypothetical protein
LKARVGAISCEASNPLHENEWAVFKNVKLPDGMILIPGVIDSVTNFIEHPELVAQRICNVARPVGRENASLGPIAASPLSRAPHGSIARLPGPTVPDSHRGNCDHRGDRRRDQLFLARDTVSAATGINSI